MNNSDGVRKEEITVTFVNGVEDADVWILPQTEENLETSLWGTATLGGSAKGATETCRIEGGAQHYIVRIIDKDEAYYAANKLALHEGYTLRFVTAATKYDAVIEILDEKGDPLTTKEGVFEGVL